MIEAKGLNVGNLLEDADGCIFEVDGEYLTLLELESDLADGTPIPLTNAMLNDLGLNNGYFGKGDCWRVCYDNRVIEFSDKCSNKDVHGCLVCLTGGYVHTLQNKIHALTDEFVTIKGY